MKWCGQAAIVMMMGVAACSEPAASGEQSASSEQPAAEAGRPASAGGQDLPTAEWLAGEWCLNNYTAGGEVNEENITYIFNPDGTLLYQNNSSTDVDRPGSFETADGKLLIKPALGSFRFDLASRSEDAMVLSTPGAEFNWTRGACSG